MNFALVGFMGSGKTTTANQLKNYYENYKIFSIDDEIEKNERKSIKNIFLQYGENYFRNLENKVIQKIILNNKNYILDLGAGAFIQENNRKLLKENNVKTIFLNVTIEEIYKRLENQRNIRPLLLEDNWKEKAKKLFEYRYDFYKLANLTIKIEDNSSPEDVINLLYKRIQKD